MLALWLTLLTDVNIVKTLFCDPRPQSWKRQTQGSVWNSHSHHSFSRSNRQQDSPGPFKPQTLGLPQGLIIAGGCLGNLYIKRHLCFSGLSFPSFQECSFSTIGTDIKVLLLLLKVMLKKMTRAGRQTWEAHDGFLKADSQCDAPLACSQGGLNPVSFLLWGTVHAECVTCRPKGKTRATGS